MLRCIQYMNRQIILNLIKGAIYSMELIFLGTGAGVPSKNRNVSSLALSLLQEINEVWLFDCGEATQHQILNTSIRPGKISKVFITHLHGDHIYGLPGFLSSRSFQGGDDPLTVYGPEGIKNFIEVALKTSKTHLTYPIKVIEYEEGEIFSNDKFTVSCQKLDHRIDSYGFRIVEADQIGELLVDRLKEEGIMPGPIYREIKENEKITLPSGKIIERKDFVGPSKKGRILAIFGDTRYKKEHVKLAKKADVLVHEATFSAAEDDLAEKYFHTTTKQAAKLAEKSKVKQLLLTHISSRYQKNTDLENLLEEARSVFPSTFIAHDFYRYRVKHY